MADQKNYGRTRLAVGAHYGTKDFIIQRVTAIILAVYSIVFLVSALFTGINYQSWVGFFSFTCMDFPLGRVAATLAFLALAYHVWIGVRDIWMDYVQPVSIRLTLHVLTILWLIGSVIYFAKIVWSI